MKITFPFLGAIMLLVMSVQAQKYNFVKHLLSFLLIVMTTLSVNAYDFESSGFYFNIKSASECYVTQKAENVSSYSGNITIPSSVTYNGKSYNVTGIEYKAFSGCNELISVVIPTSIKKYPACLFMQCANLASVTLPNNLTEIPSSMFYQCPNLRSISIPSTVKKICSLAFYQCTSLQEVSLPNGLTTIESSAFNTCSSLKSIELPSTVETLGDCAFFCCNDLESVILNEGLKAIEYATFYNCKSLKTINIPSTITDINRSSTSNVGNFEGCESLQKFTVANGNMRFSTSNGVLMDYNKTIVYICPEGYKGSFTCPNTTTQLASYSFNSCKDLTEVHLSQKITNIPANAFSYCTNLNKINLHEGIVTINSNAFSGCRSLTEIIIPSSVNVINSKAFAFCSGLKSITSNATTPPNCNADAFDYITADNCVLFVPNNSYNSYKNAEGWNSFVYVTDGIQPVYIGSIDVTSDTYTLNIGQTSQLSYSFKPEFATETAIKWASSNDNIATVSENGIVTGEGIGTVEITCYPEKGNGRAGKAYLVVFGTPITNLSVSPNTLYLTEGNNGNVNIEILPENASNKTLKISSSDDKVAYGIGNVIYALKEGAAIIKYETQDGSNLSAQVIVVVSSSTGINNVNKESKVILTPRKVILNNKLYIQKNNGFYNLNGIKK